MDGVPRDAAEAGDDPEEEPPWIEPAAPAEKPAAVSAEPVDAGEAAVSAGRLASPL